MWLNTSKGISCFRRSKLTFCYFLNGCSFSSILTPKILKSDIAFFRYGNFIEDVIRVVEKSILRKRLLKFGNLYKVLVFWEYRCPFLHEHTFFSPNPSCNLKIKYCRFQNMWNLKIDWGTIFWDILTLHLHNSKIQSSDNWYLLICCVTNIHISTIQNGQLVGHHYFDIDIRELFWLLKVEPLEAKSDVRLYEG